MLAGLLKAPSRFNPFNDQDAGEVARRAGDRATWWRPVNLTQEEASAISEAAAPSMSTQASSQIGQHFADWVIDQVSSYVGYADQDLVVQTTLDPALQQQAEATLARVLAEQGPAMKASQGALVTMRPTAPCVAMVGGTDYRGSQFNRATQALRQPGSAFKAFVFLAAFENGYVPGNQLRRRADPHRQLVARQLPGPLLRRGDAARGLRPLAELRRGAGVRARRARQR